MLDLKGITKKYPQENKTVLQEVSLKIKQNDFVAIMGKSGCGKSTLLNILGCLDVCTAGEYLIDDKNVINFTQKQKAQLRSTTFGFVFQSFNLLNDKTVLQNVILPLEYSTVPKAQHKKCGEQMLMQLGIEELASKTPSCLSGGEQQRVAIARALINSPKIILADEPTGNLDSETGKQIMRVLCQLHESGKTIIMVTHDVKIASYAGRIIELNKGKIEKSVCDDEGLIC